MVYDSKTKTVKDVLYPNNSKIEYPIKFMLDDSTGVCTAPYPQQNSFILSGGSLWVIFCDVRLCETVKLGYNDHGYNKFIVIASKTLGLVQQILPKELHGYKEQINK